MQRTTASSTCCIEGVIRVNDVENQSVPRAACNSLAPWLQVAHIVLSTGGIGEEGVHEVGGEEVGDEFADLRLNDYAFFEDDQPIHAAADFLE